MDRSALIASKPDILRDARPLLRDGRIAGFALRLASDRVVQVLSPKALVATFDCEFGNPYGCPLFEAGVSGVVREMDGRRRKKLLRQRMWKDAYVGDIFWYPPDTEVELPNGQTCRGATWRRRWSRRAPAAAR